jgi:hypothetical protein
MQVVAVAAAALLWEQAVQMLYLAVQVAQAEVAPEVRQVVAQLQQEQQVRPTQVPVAAAADIATNQTHPLRVVLVVRASLLCVTSYPHLQLPTWQAHSIADHPQLTTSQAIAR